MSELGFTFARLLKETGAASLTWLQATMLLIGMLLVYLAIRKEFEPLLLLPMGIGATLSNLPLAGMFEEGGLLYYFYFGAKTGVFPLLIFLGIGALTDFGPLLANPKTILLGAAAQFGIFGAFLLALALGFNLFEASSIGIIGAADGPTAIYLTSKLAPHMLGPVAVAAYSYMALVPLIQPPIMKALTTPEERKIRMVQRKPVSRTTRILFPVVTMVFCGILLPSAAPLIGMLMLGNLLRECGVVERLLKTAENELLNIVTIFLGLAVGASMTAEGFLNLKTLFILLLGFCAFCIGIASGILFGKAMKVFSKDPINPLIGAAGISAVPMAARVVHKMGQEADRGNYLLMHAMGPNVAGQIGSAVGAGVLFSLVGGG